MAEFTPITISTQEELNKMFADRGEQARRAEHERMEKQYAGFDEFKAKAEKYDKDMAAKDQQFNELKTESTAKIAELEGKIREYETASVKTKIAREAGLPYELAERLSGADEAAIRADAENLSKLIRSKHVAPMYSQSGEGVSDSKDAMLKDLLKKVRE